MPLEPTLPSLPSWGAPATPPSWVPGFGYSSHSPLPIYLSSVSLPGRCHRKAFSLKNTPYVNGFHFPISCSTITLIINAYFQLLLPLWLIAYSFSCKISLQPCHLIILFLLAIFNNYLLFISGSFQQLSCFMGLQHLW